MAFLPPLTAAEIVKIRPNIAVMIEFDFASGPWRVWMGHGDLEAGGQIWQGLGQVTDIGQIEQFVNGAAQRFTLTASGVSQEILNVAVDLQDEALFRIYRIYFQVMAQDMTKIGPPFVAKTVVMDTITINESRVTDGETLKTVSVEGADITSIRSRASLSNYAGHDGAIIHPNAVYDRGFERIPGLADQTVVWPDA